MAEALPENVAAAVWRFVSGPLLDNPHRVGKRLRFELEGYYSARRGQYRVIYRIDEHQVIVDLIKISHRETHTDKLGRPAGHSQAAGVHDRDRVGS